MSTWSRPYITVTDADGFRVNWTLPSPMPWPAGACADESLRTPADLGLPVGGTVKVRWRTPNHTNPRSLTRPTSDLQIVALAGDVRRAYLAEGVGWMPDANGWPLRVRSQRAATPSPATTPTPATTPAPEKTDVVPVVGPRAMVSPANATIADIASGRLPLGSTVAQVVTAIRRKREIEWAGAHKVNMHNMLDFLEQVLVYTEPADDDTDAELPEVAAWMRARLDLPGVEVGGSVHVALLLAPDLERAIEHRRYTDRRTELLNDQALKRHYDQWARYEAAIARRAGRSMGGQQPKRPADLVLRAPQVPVAKRTEELFATGLGMVPLPSGSQCAVARGRRIRPRRATVRQGACCGADRATGQLDATGRMTRRSAALPWVPLVGDGPATRGMPDGSART